MNRKVLAYAGALGVLLLSSYLTWTHEAVEEKEGESVVLEVGVEQVSAIQFRSEDIDLDLRMAEDGAGRYATVSTVRRKSIKPAAPDEGPTPNPEPEKPQRYTFTGGRVADQMVEFMAPMMASRGLGVIEDGRLADFGLEPPRGTLTVEASGSKHEYTLGDPLSAGRQVYLRDQASGEVYAVQGKLSSWLLRADTQLPGRALSPLQPDELARVKLQSDGRSGTWEHRNRPQAIDPEGKTRQLPADGSLPYWTRAGDMERDDAAGAWMTKALRITARRFVQEGEAPEDLQSRFTMVFVADDGTEWPVEVLEGTNAEGAPTWYARSTHLRSLVEVNEAIASESAGDLGELL